MTSRIDGITVVIAAYNAQNTIGRAVLSALSQKEVAEVFVVDDASTDKTAEAAMYYANQSRKIRLIIKSKNSGPASSRNIALDLCRTPFFAVLDADDEFLPNRFLEIDDGDWDFLSDNIIFIPHDTGEDVKSLMPGDQIHLERELSFDEFLASNISLPQEKGIELGFMKPIVRCSTIRRLGISYDDNLRLGEDYLFYAHALAKGARVRLTNRYGYLAHVSDASLSRRHSTRDLEALMHADDRLIDMLAADDAPTSAIGLVRRHRTEIWRKIVNRRFLDDKKRLGAMRAIANQATHPRLFARIVADIIRDRQRHADVTTRPRSLFNQGDFAGMAPHSSCS